MQNRKASAAVLNFFVTATAASVAIQQELLHPKMEEVVGSCCWSCFLSFFFSFLFFCFWSLLCMEVDWLELLQGWGSLEKANPDMDVASRATLRIRLRFMVEHSFNFHQDVFLPVARGRRMHTLQ
jgi:hypothetical protein